MREKATGRWGAATYPAVFAVLEDDLRTVVGQLASGKDADRAANSIRCGGSLQLSTERFKGTAARALGAPVSLQQSLPSPLHVALSLKRILKRIRQA